MNTQLRIKKIKFKINPKSFKFLILVGILLLVFLFGVKNLKIGPEAVHAQVPTPTVSCGDTRNPEFNSLRPYQASPCQTTMDQTAKFCGNDLIFHDTIEEHYPGGGTCKENNGKITCTYDETIDKNLVIDLSGANLPIMGNTEDVKNSQSTNNSLDNANKVNEYVSWYLNGTTNRAEYGDNKDNFVDFSGPLKKLLPSAIQDAQRIKTLSEARKTNHNQIVVCAKGESVIGDITGLGTFTPTDCYDGNGTSAKGSVFRLKTEANADGWDGNLSIWNSVMGKIVDGMSIVFPGVVTETIQKYIGKPWDKRIPPLPWSDANGKPFANEELYLKAYNEWKGKTCAIVPVINKVVCLNNILVPNKYADLFDNIPLSSTEDLKGSVSVDSVSSSTQPTEEMKISNVKFNNQVGATLFFPHMQESSDLANFLQNTFVSTSQQGNKNGSPTNVSQPASCSDVEVRSNKGDKLFATQITGNLHYEAKFSCDFDIAPTCSGVCTSQLQCKYAGGTNADGSCSGNDYCCKLPGVNTSSTQPCKKDIYVSLSTIASTPKADDIWSRLVAGPESVFKRIFPKTNTENGMGAIMDIPGSTNIIYTGLGISQQNTDLKFPHIGGISEYFLKGIQTALRPKGFGEQISFGTSSNKGSSGTINCNQNIPDIQIPRLNKSDAQRISEIWYGQGVGKSYFKECNNDVIQRANNKGVNPIFVLAIWIHESAASNYQAKSPVEDFGIHGSSTAPPNNFSAQLDAFLDLPDFYLSCGKKDLNTFISMFWFGHCSPQNQDEQSRLARYINELKFIYSAMAPGVTLPTWPK